jgi:hypothetical protein
MRDVFIQTDDQVGHGTTTAMVLAQAILKKRFETMRDETDVMRDHARNPLTEKQLPLNAPQSPSRQSRSRPKRTFEKKGLRFDNVFPMANTPT